MRLPVNRCLPLAALVLLGACPVAARDVPAVEALPTSGPAADYPMVLGAPFTIDGKEWTPSDQLNYDAVGGATIAAGSSAVDAGGLRGISGAHKTLPLPSYVEVTALDTGRTILLRVVERGPMANDTLLALSPDAAAQLGLSVGGPVRVRRVNPPELERAMLRTGGRAPERMATPEGLLKVLRRKLAGQSPLAPAMPISSPVTGAAVSVTQQGPATRTATVTTPAPTPRGPIAAAAKPPAPKPASPAPAKGSLVVQVGTFASEPNARKLASQLGGNVSRSGKFWRVSLGSFANRAQAAGALEKAKAAGYSDARIQNAD